MPGTSTPSPSSGNTTSTSEAQDVISGGYTGIDDSSIIADDTNRNPGMGPSGPAQPHSAGEDRAALAANHSIPGVTTGPDPKEDPLGDPQSQLQTLMDLGYTKKEAKKMLATTIPGGDGQTYADKQDAYMKNQYAKTYFSLWGETPPKKVLEDALDRGLNVFEFEDEQRQKPAFRKTETYKNEYLDQALALAQALGVM